MTALAIIAAIVLLGLVGCWVGNRVVRRVETGAESPATPDPLGLRSWRGDNYDLFVTLNNGKTYAGPIAWYSYPDGRRLECGGPEWDLQKRVLDVIAQQIEWGQHAEKRERQTALAEKAMG